MTHLKGSRSRVESTHFLYISTVIFNMIDANSLFIPEVDDEMASKTHDDIIAKIYGYMSYAYENIVSVINEHPDSDEIYSKFILIIPDFLDALSYKFDKNFFNDEEYPGILLLLGTNYDEFTYDEISTAINNYIEYSESIGKLRIDSPFNLNRINRRK